MANDIATAMAKLQAMRAASEPAKVETEEPRREAEANAAAAHAMPAPTAHTPLAGALSALKALTAQSASTTVAMAAAPAPAVAAPIAALEPPAQLPVNPEMQSQHPELVAQVQQLADALHKQEPGIEHWLERIHEQLRAYPELCHILTPEQVRALCSGWMQKTQSYVVATVTKSRSGTKAAKLAGTKLSDDDL